MRTNKRLLIVLSIFLLSYSILCMYLSLTLEYLPGSPGRPSQDLVYFLVGCSVASFLMSAFAYFNSRQYKL